MERRVLINRSALAGSAARDAAAAGRPVSPGSVRIQAGSAARSAEIACRQDFSSESWEQPTPFSGVAGFSLRAQKGRVFQPRPQAQTALSPDPVDELASVSLERGQSAGRGAEQVQQALYPDQAQGSGTGTSAVTRWKEALRSHFS